MLVRLFRDWFFFLADRSSANTKQLSISRGGQQFMVSPAGKGSGLHSRRMTYDWQQLPCTGENCHTILRFKLGFDHRRSTMGKSQHLPHGTKNHPAEERSNERSPHENFRRTCDEGRGGGQDKVTCDK